MKLPEPLATRALFPYVFAVDEPQGHCTHGGSTADVAKARELQVKYVSTIFDGSLAGVAAKSNEKGSSKDEDGYDSSRSTCETLDSPKSMSSEENLEESHSAPMSLPGHLHKRKQRGETCAIQKLPLAERA